MSLRENLGPEVFTELVRVCGSCSTQSLAIASENSRNLPSSRRWWTQQQHSWSSFSLTPLSPVDKAEKSTRKELKGSENKSVSDEKEKQKSVWSHSHSPVVMALPPLWLSWRYQQRVFLGRAHPILVMFVSPSCPAGTEHLSRPTIHFKADPVSNSGLCN